MSEGTVESENSESENRLITLTLPASKGLDWQTPLFSLLFKPPSLRTAHCLCEYFYCVLPRRVFFFSPCKSTGNDLKTKVSVILN